MRSLVTLLLGLILAAGALGQEQPKAVVRGRVLRADGLPAAGADVVFSHWGITTKEGRPAGRRRAKWRMKATAGDDGGYSIQVDASPTARYELAASLYGGREESTTWVGLAPDETKAVEDLVLPVPCFVNGHLESSDGELLTEGWVVMGTSLQQGAIQGRVPMHRTRVDPKTGTFRLGPFSAGPIVLFARSTQPTHRKKITVLAREGEPTYVAFRVEDLSPQDCLRIQLICRKFPGMQIQQVPGSVGGAAPEGLVLLDPTGAASLRATKRSSGAFDWEIGPVAVGEYEVEFRHPAFRPVRLSNLVPGAQYSVDLEGNSSVVLDVVDESGLPLTEYGATVLYQAGPGPTTSHTYTSSGDPMPVGGRLEGLVAGDCLVRIEPSPGRSVTRRVEGLLPGESRALRIEVPRPPGIEVFVVHPDGTPAVDQEVLASSGRRDPLYSFADVGGQLQMSANGIGRTGPQGSVRLSHAKPGRWTVRAPVSPYAFTEEEFRHDDRTSSIVRLTLPETVRLEGRLAYEGPFDLTQLCLFVSLADQEDDYRVMRRGSQPLPWLGPDGRFVIEGVPAGRVRLEVLLGNREDPSAFRGKPIFEDVLQVAPGKQPYAGDLQRILQSELLVMPETRRGDALGDEAFLVPEPRAREVAAGGRPRDYTDEPLIETGEFEIRFRRLVPLEDYRLFVVGPRGGWIADGGLVDGIKPADEGFAAPVLDLLEQAIRFTDADGSPLQQQSIGWSCRGWTGPACRATTDAAGRLTLALPRGSYSFFRVADPKGQQAPTLWRPRKAKESELVLVLPASTEDR